MNKITEQDIFLYAANRVEDDRAKQIRRACVHSEVIRRWLFAICDDAQAIYARAVREYVSTITPQMMADSEQLITEAYRKDWASKDDEFLEVDDENSTPPVPETPTSSPNPESLDAVSRTRPLQAQNVV